MEDFNSKGITSEEMAILDNNSEWLGIPKSHLMECAGYSFTSELISKGFVNQNFKIAIFCGTGNNGGDGFVIARHLSAYGFQILVILVGSPDKIRTPEAQLNWDIIHNNLNYSILTEVITDSSELPNIKLILENDDSYNLIIDGLLGTGIKGQIREPISSTIDLINDLKEVWPDRLKIVSIDVPSGFDPNTGRVSHKTIISDLVITFHRQKKGMEKKSKYIKEIVVTSIGIPQEAHLFVGKGDLLPCLKVRKIDNHKGQFGRLLVIGGSKNYSGAPAYSSLTGINFGCDLVITYTPDVIGNVLRSYSPNMIVRTSAGDWLNLDAESEILELTEWANTVVIGPGMGTNKETEKLFLDLLSNWKNKEKSLVIDADGLKLIKNHFDLIKGKNVILTPHHGEFKIMTDIDLPDYSKIQETGKIVHEVAKKLSLTLLVKGPYDYISNGKYLKINKTGCPEMSIGGTGDVLAGLCGCFLTTGNNPFQSACSAAFLNGYIGEYCKENLGLRFTALDMIQNINNGLLELKNY